MSEEKMLGPVFVTKYWESRGVLRFDASRNGHIHVSDDGSRYFVWQDERSRLFIPASQYFTDESKAQESVRRKAAARVKSMRKKLAELDRAALDGKPVTPWSESK